MALTRDQFAQQYRVVCEAAALVPRPERGIIEVTGPDRAIWINNLVTNVVKNLAACELNYGFAVNVKVRVICDLNMLVLDDPARPDGRLWLDVDAGWIAEAMRHLDRYIITENVKLTDLTPRLTRFAIL